ncbi:hypothetical protein UA08_07385 [Talaromyces atroroseus]|uniref:Rhodopsin domain-containing protein n=1 Tax=Talaromyces atroroseus TaxID=1441469 RepID=A0A225AS07_TALAT|nr:hypothetical protein UA08_07385 [Talaromyces atroroseus]OKL57225.1 hypothetical protein UA08_07385 [Talaromyces atroroseus]
MVNTSTSPPTLANPHGAPLVSAPSVVLVFMTFAVAARLWGRYRYRTLSSSRDTRYGESRFWILLSDITIVLSFIMNVALTAVCFVAVKWGEGIHTKELSLYQVHKVLEMFYVYQVLYKFVSGIAKIATLFLLLAIATPQMRAFHTFCKFFILYIAAYCLACSLATVFQCSTDFESNWNKALSQKKCFTLPPFWYTHAAINISATMVMIFLPWWLFSTIQYKRKYAIAIIMSSLAVAETALGVVRLYGLYKSAHSKGDMTYGTVTGILVSQLEIDFACIAACVPTVLKMLEEALAFFIVRVLGRTYNGTSGMKSSHNDNTTGGSAHIMSNLRSKDREPRIQGPYTSFDKDDQGGSMDSQEHIIGKVDPPTSSIKVQTDYYVTINE